MSVEIQNRPKISSNDNIQSFITVSDKKCQKNMSSSTSKIRRTVACIKKFSTRQIAGPINDQGQPGCSNVPADQLGKEPRAFFVYLNRCINIVSIRV